MLKIQILGCGSSGGVPRSDGEWGHCDPSNSKNRRTRCSLALQWGAALQAENRTSLIIDTSPDFRTQVLMNNVRHIDAVLWTHDHADQVHGIDDIRGFVSRQGLALPGYMDMMTAQTLTHRFCYIFKGNGGYPAICLPHIIEPLQPFMVMGKGGPLDITPFPVQHGRIKALGFRVHDVAHCPDVSDIDEAVLDQLTGLKLWIVDALRYTPHPTHAHIEKTLGWINRVKPQQAILTNLHHDLDYEVLKSELPDGVIPAYDGLEVVLTD